MFSSQGLKNLSCPHNPIEHHPLTDSQLIPEHPSVGPQTPPLSLYTDYDVPWCGIFLSAGQLLSPCFLCSSLPGEPGKLKSPCLRVSTTQQQLKHQRCSHMKSKTRHCTNYQDENYLYPSWNQDTLYMSESKYICANRNLHRIPGNYQNMLMLLLLDLPCSSPLTNF